MIDKPIGKTVGLDVQSLPFVSVDGVCALCGKHLLGKQGVKGVLGVCCERVWRDKLARKFYKLLPVKADIAKDYVAIARLCDMSEKSVLHTRSLPVILTGGDNGTHAPKTTNGFVWQCYVVIHGKSVRKYLRVGAVDVLKGLLLEGVKGDKDAV